MIILLNIHWLLLNIELLVEALLTRDELQNRTFYHDIYIVEIVARLARDPFSWRNDLLGCVRNCLLSAI